MMKKSLLTGLLLAILSMPVLSHADFVPVSFEYNSTGSGFTGAGSAFPRGDLVYGGVDFSIPTSSNFMWYSLSDADKTMTTQINATGVDKVYTIINTAWGTTNTNYYAVISFSGDNGANFDYYIYGGVNTRDYNNGGYTNSYSDPATQQVWSSGNARLDMQTIDLPDEFLAASLITVTLTDYGRSGTQNVFLYGMTAETTGTAAPVPEPATLLLCAGGLFVLVAARKTYKRS